MNPMMMSTAGGTTNSLLLNGGGDMPRFVLYHCCSMLMRCGDGLRTKSPKNDMTPGLLQVSTQRGGEGMGDADNFYAAACPSPLARHRQTDKTGLAERETLVDERWREEEEGQPMRGRLCC